MASDKTYIYLYLLQDSVVDGNLLLERAGALGLIFDEGGNFLTQRVCAAVAFAANFLAIDRPGSL